MVYIVENNGVYGLTKGQFSATADAGSTSKSGVGNTDQPIDLVAMALQLGATFVARSFSGDKDQLVPLIKAAIRHHGAAFIDVHQPLRRLQQPRRLDQELRLRPRAQRGGERLDWIERRDEITTDYAPGTVSDVTQHDGSVLRLRKLDEDYDPTDKLAAMSHIAEGAGGGRDRHRPPLHRRRPTATSTTA